MKIQVNLADIFQPKPDVTRANERAAVRVLTGRCGRLSARSAEWAIPYLTAWPLALVVMLYNVGCHHIPSRRNAQHVT
jgi:hypothetical protein